MSYTVDFALAFALSLASALVGVWAIVHAQSRSRDLSGVARCLACHLGASPACSRGLCPVHCAEMCRCAAKSRRDDS